MIKNDAWIIEQSTPPKFMVGEYITEGTDATQLRIGQRWRLSHQSFEELAALAQQTSRYNEGASDVCPGVFSFRPVTPEDLIDWRPMIEPFEAQQVREKHADAEVGTQEQMAHRVVEGFQKVISYGVSSFGYDVRIADEFMIFTNVNSVQVDPKCFNEKSFVRFQGEVCVIPPNSFVLARSLEYFRMPRSVSGLVLGKSTYARCGVNCIATPLEPGWEGHITLEYINGTPLPARLYANEGAAQVQFFEGEQPLVSYADRGGKYQGQRGITLPKA